MPALKVTASSRIINVPVRVTKKRIRELISEAGSRYWAKQLVFKRGLGFTIIEHGDGGPDKKHTVTEEQVIAGLVTMANAKSDEGGHHFQAVLDEYKSDMYTGDAVIQFAVFGELKYG